MAAELQPPRLIYKNARAYEARSASSTAFSAHVHDARNPDSGDEAAVNVPVDDGPRIDRTRLRQRPHSVRAPAVPDASELADACEQVIPASGVPCSHSSAARNPASPSPCPMQRIRPCLSSSPATAPACQPLLQAASSAEEKRTLDRLKLVDDVNQQRTHFLWQVRLLERPSLLGQLVPACARPRFGRHFNEWPTHTPP